MKTFKVLVQLTCVQLAVVIAWAGLSQLGSAQNQRHSRPAKSKQAYADDTLIITLNPGADMDKVNEVLDDVHGTIVRTLHVDAGNYSILFVQPEPGKADETVKKISDTKDKSFKSITRNKVLKGSGTAIPNSVPNDPFFFEQWNLAALNWTQARNDFGSRFRTIPHVVDLDSGIQPIFEKHELSNVTQYNALNAKIDPFLEVPFDDMINYPGAPGHGTACFDTYGARTDNQIDTAGVASFTGSIAPHVYEFRCLNSQDNATTDAMVSAMVFVINNQAKLGGPSPVNISIDSDPPTWSSEPFMTLAQTIYSQGSLVVWCAGDYKRDDTVDYQKPKVAYARVVQGTDELGKLGGGSFGSDYLGNNTAAAPGYNVDLMWGNHQLLNSYGTSFAAPTWAGCIAVLQSISPQLTAPQADVIVFNTARSVQSPPAGKSSPVFTLRIPNLDAAIKAL